MNATPGWYGKLPALGDFAHRRLPPEFIEPWDRWLQQGLQASRAALGQDWLGHYLGTPVWRFVLLPGVIGESGWAGVLMPSVDRVGRYFPLTLCTRLPEAAPLGDSLWALDGWLGHLETCALQGLDAAHGLERLESALRLMAPWQPAPQPADPSPAGRGIRFTSQRTTDTPNGFLDGLAARVLPRALAGHSICWCGNPDGDSTGLARPGLPPPADFAQMLSGTGDADNTGGMHSPTP